MFSVSDLTIDETVSVIVRRGRAAVSSSCLPSAARPSHDGEVAESSVVDARASEFIPVQSVADSCRFTGASLTIREIRHQLSVSIQS